MRDRSRPILLACTLAALPLFLCGCRSAWVRASVTNNQSTPVRLVEVDYPGGSFGVQSIAPHATFHYRFHILANDKVTLDFNDPSGKPHKATGPDLQQGDQGSLQIQIDPGNRVSWNPSLTRHP